MAADIIRPPGNGGRRNACPCWQQVAELRGHADYVHAVAWSPDGTRLIFGSRDFTIRVWDSLAPAARAPP